MSSTGSTNVTQLLLDWRAGKQEALDRLMPLVYDELRQLASQYMRRERSQHTLEATALAARVTLAKAWLNRELKKANPEKSCNPV
jgi:hypothetical protein